MRRSDYNARMFRKLALVLLIAVPDRKRTPKAAAARLALDGRHGQAAGGDRRRDDFSKSGDASTAAAAMIAATCTMWTR